MFILKKGHQPGVYMPLRALFLVENTCLFSGERSLPFGLLVFNFGLITEKFSSF